MIYRLTALLLVVFPLDKGSFVLKAMGIALLICPILLTNPLCWFIITAKIFSYGLMHWFLINNHEFLIIYWCFTCWIATYSKNKAEVLAWNAMIMVGFSFLFAELWKFRTGEFFNGLFLYGTFLNDHRFTKLVTWLSPLPAEFLANNRDIVDTMRNFPTAGLTATLNTHPWLKIFAMVFSYWTLAIEALLPLAYLSKWPKLLHRHRNLLLITFIITTYFFMPLHRFAYILSIFGYASCPKDLKIYRAIHLILFALIPFF